MHVIDRSQMATFFLLSFACRIAVSVCLPVEAAAIDAGAARESDGWPALMEEEEEEEEDSYNVFGMGLWEYGVSQS